MTQLSVNHPEVHWNDTAKRFRDDALPVQLIVEASQRQPDAPAIYGSDGLAYTYDDLLRFAARLSRLLIDRGVGRGDHVAVIGHRSPDTIVAELGVALSGAAFVPCNPDWPVVRLSHVLSAVGARCVVGGRRDLAWIDTYPPAAPEVTDVIVLDVDTEELPYGSAVRTTPVETSSEERNPAQADHLRDLVLDSGPSAVLELGGTTDGLVRGIAPHVDLYAGLYAQEAAAVAGEEWADVHGYFVDLVQGQLHEINRHFDGPFDVAIVHGAQARRYIHHELRAFVAQVAACVRTCGTLIVTQAWAAADGSACRHELFKQLAGELWSLADEACGGESCCDADCGTGEVVLIRTEADAPAEPAARGLATATGPRVWTRWHLMQLPDHPVIPGSRPGDVAYVIFTSGSSGIPKGVSVANYALVNLVEWMSATFPVHPADRLLQTTAFSFDLSIYDVFGMLAAGASVRVASATELEDPVRLAEVLEAEPITVWNSAPPVMSWVLPFLAEQSAPNRSVRLILLAGDWIPLWMPATLRELFPVAQAVNFGGATETTVWSTYFSIETVDPGWASVPYGRPMQNARYYVLDENRNPVPVGEVGQLYAAGTVLALGYHGDPVLTAQRFVPDLYVPGERMYACGDAGMWRSDGQLQLVGRMDNQVKIRGYRVELGEIESVMAAVAGVREAFVVSIDGTSPLVLAGLYTTGEAAATSDAVRAALAARLPDYMMPALVTDIDVVPLTTNGKVDRPALARSARELFAAESSRGANG